MAIEYLVFASKHVGLQSRRAVSVSLPKICGTLEVVGDLEYIIVASEMGGTVGTVSIVGTAWDWDSSLRRYSTTLTYSSSWPHKVLTCDTVLRIVEPSVKAVARRPVPRFHISTGPVQYHSCRNTVPQNNTQCDSAMVSALVTTCGARTECGGGRGCPFEGFSPTQIWELGSGTRKVRKCFASLLDLFFAVMIVNLQFWTLSFLSAHCIHLQGIVGRENTTYIGPCCNMDLHIAHILTI